MFETDLEPTAIEDESDFAEDNQPALAEAASLIRNNDANDIQFPNENTKLNRRVCWTEIHKKIVTNYITLRNTLKQKCRQRIKNATNYLLKIKNY